MIDKRQFGSSMWGEGGLPERKYSLPSRPSRPESKSPEVKKEPLNVFGKPGFLEKSSLVGKLKARQDFFTDPNIKMTTRQREQFAEKIRKMLPSGKTTFNPGDIKIVDKKLAQQESLAKQKSIQEGFQIKRERAALKKFFDSKQ